ncbi:polysaccharide pyruvyl transferase family protein [Priestia megaterium]|uniref:polysaccharide pyruvyl transferase family protein n=1 Tax=Priestia megaterium TaxID=1404 RepID=UPI002FFE80E0
MKAGILTFHFAYNYGAVLQAYALQKTLEEYEVDVSVIDYRVKAIENKNKQVRQDKNFLSNFKEVVSNRFHNSYLNKKHKKFDAFLDNYLNVTDRTYRNYKDIVSLDLDAYVFGSDQIWNPNITGGFDQAYFGGFLPDESNAKRLSYAASIGLSTLTSQQSTDFKRLIDNLDYISLRESQATELVSNLTNKPVSTVLDPTFLLQEEQWNDIIINPSINKKYLLIYSLEENLDMIKSAYNIANKYNLEVIEIKPRKKFRDAKHRIIVESGPREMLGWLKNADIVFTNSFHGTTFSLIFNKNFFVFPHSKVPSRMISLLELLKVEERLVRDSNDIENVNDIDYESTKKSLNYHINESKAYLKQALNKE